MLRGAYTDGTTMRLRRLFARDANLSLRRIVSQMSEYPDMLHDKRRKGTDLRIRRLDRTAAYLKEQLAGISGRADP
jgi:hypothetical protein